ncbi:hypothetical protein NEOLI_001494 [Neolecta irregularis DAH-3]|uniref:Mitochondrial presequence protease n=1 Tax=Neolecta irregularis (strain DAH-3) TaxID=1198029 RepID=A0A1U7LQF0_NEOID|nr:hypothetical protein NEOLI_001494 [Neolecta irregularis DAH-3]|eukprot:OLL24900.1 hypothetical protein NEOLI_001494 [Neolecta irregularis DAH-3]
MAGILHIAFQAIATKLPVDMPLVLSKNPAFKTVTEFDTIYGNKISQYRSENTGLQIVVVDVEGPVISCHSVLATESMYLIRFNWLMQAVSDDSGCPHTLEHLVFLGSTKYPYKGILDLLANRAFAQGTNAWTAVDHTAYHIKSVSEDGFLRILPIYLDHILFPTLEESAFTTEVYHMNGSGEDAGVVFSEMQGRENTSVSLMAAANQRALYPEGNGYRSQTGGLMEALGKLDNETIRAFHKKAYVSRNLSVIVIGKLDHSQLLQAVQPLDEELAKRPWVDSAPTEDLATSVLRTVEFPDRDESMGDVRIGWFGPSDIQEIAAIDMLGVYLCNSPIAPLRKAFIEIRQPLCTGDIENKNYDAAEVDPYAGFNYAIITAFVYGDTEGKDLKRYLEDLKAFEHLFSWTEEQWAGCINKWLIEAPHVAILGKPSAVMADRLVEDNAARVKDRVEQLGKQKLEQLQKKVDDAQALNERPVPDKILEDFKIPGIDSIRDNSTQKALDSMSSGLWMQLDNIKSQFFNISLHLSTANFTHKQRLYSSLFLYNIFVNPVKRNDGTTLDWMQVVEQLDQNTVNYSASFGVANGFKDLMTIKFKVDKTKYKEAVEWIVGVTLSKMLNDLPSQARNGSGMNWALYHHLIFDEESTAKAVNLATLAKFLPQVEKVLQENPAEVIQMLEGIQQLGMYLKVYIDVSLPAGESSGSYCWTGVVPRSYITPIRYARDLLSPIGRNPCRYATILALPSIESCFSIHFSRGPQDYNDPDLAPLQVLIEYLSLLEGEFWKKIRGAGLAYGASLGLRLEEGIVEFSVYRSPNSALAFSKAREIVHDFKSGRKEFEQLALDSAKSSLVYSTVSVESSLLKAASSGFLTQVLQKRPAGYRRDFLDKICNVTIDELKKMLDKYISKIFEGETSRVAVVCSGGKSEVR